MNSFPEVPLLKMPSLAFEQGSRLHEFRSVHLIGIRGAGMKALSELLSDAGCKVTGSDDHLTHEVARLSSRPGLKLHAGHNQSNLDADVELVIYSAAIPESNPERVLAQQRGIPQIGYHQMLGWLTQSRQALCVAGTHGKSTTTAMLSTILTDSGVSPSCIIGAELVPSSDAVSGRNGWAGRGRHFVVESCEYRKHFLQYRPASAIITGIESDHFDCYENLQENVEAFRQFARLVDSRGSLLLNHACPHAAQVAASTSANVITFADRPGADWWADDFRCTSEGCRFRVYRAGDFYSEMSLPLSGRHNMLNALAAIALCDTLGISSRQIRDSLREFAGIRRRMEVMGYWKGITLLDDYAHHPTAVSKTLTALRERFGKRRIWCIFQPHQISRTKALMTEFAQSFSEADEVLITPVYAAREAVGKEPVDLACRLAKEIQSYRTSPRPRKVRFVSALDQMLRTVQDETRPGDVLVTMGAGDINWIHHELTRKLHRNYAAR